MGCKLTTTREEKDGEGRIHSASTPTQVGVSPRAQSGSHCTSGSGAQDAEMPVGAAQRTGSDGAETVLSLPTASSSCDFSPYYDPLPIEADEPPQKQKPNKKSKQKKKMHNAASLDRTDVLSDTSSRYSMSIERQRERQEAPETPSSNGSFNVDLGGTIRTASSSVGRNGDAKLEKNHNLSASRLVNEHPSDPIAMLLSPRQRTVSLAEQASSLTQGNTTPKTGKKSGGPPSTLANGVQKNTRRSATHRDDDDELVLACMDCGMDILDARASKVCPLTGKLHQ